MTFKAIIILIAMSGAEIRTEAVGPFATEKQCSIYMRVVIKTFNASPISFKSISGRCVREKPSKKA